MPQLRIFFVPKSNIRSSACQPTADCGSPRVTSHWSDLSSGATRREFLVAFRFAALSPSHNV